MDIWSNLERQDNGCWNFNGHMRGNGYRGMVYKGKQQYVHRVVWQLFNSRPIPKGMCVLHKCDNRICCNPKHLYIGNHKDNFRDMVERNRYVPIKPKYGEAHHKATLTTEQVKTIRLEYRRGHLSHSSDADTCKLAKKYNVHPATIWRIVHGLTRKGG